MYIVYRRMVFYFMFVDIAFDFRNWQYYDKSFFNSSNDLLGRNDQ